MEQIDDQYAPADVEPAIESYWDDADAYEAATEAHADDPPFFFVDGPPYTSGQMHLGTAWNKTLKDAIIRYKRMTGHRVTDRPGYDMHGLPIEVKVEEKLGFDSKRDIEEYGMEAFIEECMEFAESNREAMDEDFKSIGAWMDWDDPYKTVSPEYMESAWWAFSEVADRGLVERGKRSISQCPRCETGLANNEVEYEDVEDPSVYVKFDLADREGSLVIWTTTPWTIPANTFVAVDEELTYNAVRAVKRGESDGDGGADGGAGEDGSETEDLLYVAADCVEDVLKRGRYDDYEIEAELSGAELVGWEYDHPLADHLAEYPDFEGAGQVYAADYVEADRTGLVHSAPGHGEVDFERGRELGLEIACPVAPNGEFTDAAGEYAGQFVRDANDDIIADLIDDGRMLAHDTVEHSYGHCWRCDTGIIQLVTDQWFISITDVKDDLLENMEDSEWFPSWARDQRFRDFIEDAPDWNVSRQRYWGIPIPIWVPEDAEPGSFDEEMIVIGTRDELADRVDQSIDPDEVDLHRPTVDDLTITEDGTTYRRVEDVFDVWLDSSVASWATIGYPGETEAFEELWPADLIVEAHDQTRGWFWSQLGMATAAFDEAPYEQVLMHGFVNDSEGRKMSKSVGNIVTPEEAIERAGRDPLRTYLLSHDQQGIDLAFEWDGLGEIQGKLNILWNTFRFPLPYMDLDDYDPASADLSDGELELVDEWVLSRLQSVEREVSDAWEEYRISDAVNALIEFVTQDVSRFYIKAVRDRMWEETDSASKRGAYATIATVLDETIRMLAPIAPYVTERMYRTLDGEATTVHALAYPEPDDDLHDPDLEHDVAVMRDVEEAAATARQQAGRKLRWPVSRVVVETEDDDVANAVETLEDLILDRVNARSLVVTDRFEELEERARPQMAEIGPAFGGQAQEVMTAVEGASREAVENGGVTVDGETVELEPGMVEYEATPPEGVSAAEFDDGTVYVDTTLTDDIEAEGYARDVIRRVQEMRKDLDLEVDASIRLGVAIDDDRVADLVDEHRDLIAEETRATEWLDDPDAATDAREEWDVEGIDVTIGIDRI
ncbi:isoleucine--tRNA ligase [haloarchaeon 3A1-DGR]|nr:isoleucine--tRNA ligase [haloarchaeon 3A1-DGR]